MRLTSCPAHFIHYNKYEFIMFDAIPTSVWLAVTTTSSVLIFLALWLYLWHSHLSKHHNRDIDNVAELEAREAQLESDIRLQRKWLDDNKEVMIKIEKQRQKNPQLKGELEEIQATRAKEEATLADIRKKNVVLKAVVTSLTRERKRIQDQVDALNARIEEAKLGAEEAEKMKMTAALRANMAVMDLKTKQKELHELTELYDKQKYTGKPSDDSENVSSADEEKRVSYVDKDSDPTDVSSEIHINVI